MMGFQPRSRSTQRRRRRRARTRAIALAASPVALAVSATTAHAATTAVPYSCDYPLIGKQPVVLTVPFTPKTTAPVGVRLGTVPIKGSIRDDGDLLGLMALVQANQLSGVSRFHVPTTLPNGQVVPVVVKLTSLLKTFAADQPRIFTALGLYPSITLPMPGNVTYTAGNLDMNLLVRRPDGTPVNLGDVQNVPDSDGDPNTFDVPCTPNPAPGPILGSTLLVTAS